ncbi:MAG: ferrous iron transport protein [Pseudomonadota bacterium]|nr:ferrous iron transport protein [Pseudomonadota bacterium]
MPGVSGLLPDFETRMASMTRSPLLMSLRDLPQRASARIAAIVPHAMPDAVAQRLEELGFVPGETIRVVARGPFGREPIAVQVGFTRFALRRAEAERVMIDSASVRGA